MRVELRPPRPLMQAMLPAFALLLAAAVGQAEPPPISPIDTEYSLLRALARRGGYPQLAASTAAPLDLPERAPHELDDQLRAWTQAPDPESLGLRFRPFVSLISLATDPERQLRPLFLGVRQGSIVDPILRLRAGTYLDARVHPSITTHIRFAFDSEGANESLNRTRDFQQLEASNNFDEAYLRAHFSRGEVRIGRFAQRWGPERLGSLMLGTNSPAPDMIHGALRWGPHQLQAFVGQLSAESDSTGTYRRWLYGHRADLYFFGEDLRLGISELAVVAGISEGLDLRYLNPVALWAQVQVEDDESNATEVNILNALDAEFRRGSVRMYGSLVVDDIQIDAEGRKKNPDQLAWSAGLDWSPRDHPAWMVGYEYRRIGSWTYLRRHPGTDFRQFRRPLAAPEGPDTDRHNLRVDWRPRPQTLLWLEGERRRRGVNRLDTDLSRLGQSGRPFPIPPVEERWILSAGATWTHPPSAHVSFELAYHDISDLNNQLGRSEGVFELRAFLHLRAPNWDWDVGG